MTASSSNRSSVVLVSHFPPTPSSSARASSPAATSGRWRFTAR